MSHSDQCGPQDPMIRIAEALERLSPPPAAAPDLGQASAFVWHTQPDRLEAVPSVNRVALDLLVGINRSRDTLLENTRQFARGMAATKCNSIPRCTRRWSAARPRDHGRHRAARGPISAAAIAAAAIAV